MRGYCWRTDEDGTRFLLVVQERRDARRRSYRPNVKLTHRRLRGKLRRCTPGWGGLRGRFGGLSAKKCFKAFHFVRFRMWGPDELSRTWSGFGAPNDFVWDCLAAIGTRLERGFGALPGAEQWVMWLVYPWRHHSTDVRRRQLSESGFAGLGDSQDCDREPSPFQLGPTRRGGCRRRHSLRACYLSCYGTSSDPLWSCPASP